MKAKLGLILLFLTCVCIKAQKITSKDDIDNSLETYLNILRNTSSQDSLYQRTVDHYLQKAKKKRVIMNICFKLIYIKLL
jgi:hypothetical protein